MPERTRRIWWIAAAATALLACYWPILSGLAAQWRDDQDMSHGFLVPLCVGWIVWRERARWLALPPIPSLWGFVLLVCGAAMHFMSAGGAGLFAGAIAFLVSTVGLVLVLGGTAFLRAWTFPLLVTVFMLPKLALVYNQATLPLQLLATRIAAGMLGAVGFQVAVDGNVLQVAHQQLEVAEACNGLRFLFALGLLAVMLAWYYDRKPWMRWALLAAVVPLAILSNAARVAGAAWLATINPQYAAGTVHETVGAVVFLACLPVLGFLIRVLNRIYAHFHEV